MILAGKALGAQMTSKRQSLAQRRRALGYSQERLAEKLGVERSTIRRWEQGETEPLPHIRPRIAAALEVSLAELHEWLHHTADEKPLVARNRDPFSLQTPAADRGATALDGSAGKISVPSRLGLEDVRDIARANELFDRSDFLLGGDVSCRAALARLAWGPRVLEQATMSSSVRQELQKVLARLANRAGFMCFDAGNYDNATECFHLALKLSAEAGDWEFRTNILESMCHQAITLSRPAEAIGYCAMAETSPVPPPANIRSLLNVMSAWGYAILGDVYATRHQLDKSLEYLDTYVPENAPAWSWWFDRSDVEGKVGRVLCELAKRQSRNGRPLIDEACAILERSIVVDRPDIVRTNTLNLTKLAEVRMLHGDWDEGARITRQVLTAAASVRSQRVTGDLRDLLKVTAQHPGADAADLREQIQLTLATMS